MGLPWDRILRIDFVSNKKTPLGAFFFVIRKINK